MSDWMKPIETAPQDGSFIWAYSPARPHVLVLVRWARSHSYRSRAAWVTPKGNAISHIPTRWFEAEQPK